MTCTARQAETKRETRGRNTQRPKMAMVVIGKTFRPPQTQFKPCLNVNPIVFFLHTMSRGLSNVKPDESYGPGPQTVAPAARTPWSDSNIPISETDPRDWTYIAEGGSTAVFSYDGPHNLHLDGTVIRLRKSSLPSGSDSTPSASDEKASRNTDDPTVDFQEHVISRLVPAEFLPHLEHVQVERDWLERMVSVHDEKRPAKRRENGIDLERTRAVLATGLIGSKGWAVEIKVSSSFNDVPNFRSNCDGAYSQSGDSNLKLISWHPHRALSNRACVGSA
jgi:hypothetical protein